MSDTLKGSASAPASAAEAAPTPAHGIIADIEAYIRKIEDEVGAIPSDAWRMVKVKLAELKSHL